MKHLILLVLIISCGKEPARSKSQQANSSTLATPDIIPSIELVTIGCAHAPTCGRYCLKESAAANFECDKITTNSIKRTCQDVAQAQETKCMMSTISIDKKLTDTEIIKNCYQESDGGTTCPDAGIDGEFTFITNP